MRLPARFIVELEPGSLQNDSLLINFEYLMKNLNRASISSSGVSIIEYLYLEHCWCTIRTVIISKRLIIVRVTVVCDCSEQMMCLFGTTCGTRGAHRSTHGVPPAILIGSVGARPITPRSYFCNWPIIPSVIHLPDDGIYLPARWSVSRVLTRHSPPARWGLGTSQSSRG